MFGYFVMKCIHAYVTVMEIMAIMVIGCLQHVWIITQNQDLCHKILKHKYYTNVWQSIVANLANIVSNNERFV